MTVKAFYLLGEDPNTALDIEVDFTHDFETLQEDVAQHFGVAVPSGGLTSRQLIREYC